MYKQIGNSITVPLVIKLAKGIVAELDKAEKGKAAVA
jgi:site-specific DNA-cytosine methylase